MESILRLSDGGFGLIWDADEQALGLYMAAGIPVIVKKGLSCEKYVTDNEIGAAATDFEDVYRMVTHGRSAGRNFYRTRMYMDLKLNLMRMVQSLIRTASCRRAR